MDRPVVRKNGNSTLISFFTLNHRAEERVRTEIEQIFANKDMDDMKDIIYTCVKELMVNASKSNIKKTFFIEAKISENDRKRYQEARQKVKKLMDDRYFSYLQNKLEKYDHNVEVGITDKGNGVVITVKNPTPLLGDEEEKVRRCLDTAMNSDTSDLALFYNDDAENSEGATLGLMLVVNLLRQMNVNPALFRIGVLDGDTIARIEIPVNSEYKSERGENESYRKAG